ncbi:hypothetical protein EYF80_026513 [Liparis tanakae]|uniref:Uncharacterized protein n=1 Tax=Liparis tanakae TaxID=230148 RepID=A0A4Z2HEP9_9TELE|nr:hypothetical protein EYF80_026513 [Liparis tanakae]
MPALLLSLAPFAFQEPRAAEKLQWQPAGWLVVSLVSEVERSTKPKLSCQIWLASLFLSGMGHMQFGATQQICNQTHSSECSQAITVAISSAALSNCDGPAALSGGSAA